MVVNHEFADFQLVSWFSNFSWTIFFLLSASSLFLCLNHRWFTSQRAHGWFPATRNIQMLNTSMSSDSTPMSSPSCKYDVFLNFRGDDVRKTFVDHLFKALEDRRIRTYKDDQTLPPGESIGPSLFMAIKESQIAVTVFSKDYASSTWCLDELACMINLRKEKRLIILPIFYNVTPSEMRSSTGPFGSALAKQMKENTGKAKLWREAVDEASRISGWEPKKMAGGFESKAIDKIVDAIFSSLLSCESRVDEDLVGMTDRLLELETRLDTKSDDVLMVGIWGLGGIGKTTLAISLKNKISKEFFGHCILMDVGGKAKENGLEKLQENILLSLFKRNENIQCVDDGKVILERMLHNKKVLVVLDGVSHVSQLQALAGKHSWFGKGSRIIITTRNEHLLTTHRIDVIHPVRLLSMNESIQLFKRYAYNENHRAEDVAELSKSMITYAAGLPLALQHLGTSVCGKSKNACKSLLEKLTTISDSHIMNVLKISFDGLEPYLQNLFLDIACFWRMKMVDEAMKILKAFDYFPEHGIEVLRENALISISDDGMFSGATFDMHDLVQEMGHRIVRGNYPNNPEKHSRVWEPEKIRCLCLGGETILKDNYKIEAIKFNYEFYDRDLSSCFSHIVSNMKSLRWLSVKSCENADQPASLSNELQYLDWKSYPACSFPDNFNPTKLVGLKLEGSMQRELWRGYERLPYLKELCLIYMHGLAILPDFSGLTCLEELRLVHCYLLEEIPKSLGQLKSLKCLTIVGCPIKRFPTTVQMDNLETLEMVACDLEDGDIPSSFGELSNLQELDLRENCFSQLDFSLSKLTQLKLLNLSSCKLLLELPDLPSSLAILKSEDCFSLERFGDCHSKCLREVSLKRSGIINDGSRLLQSMIEGEAVENRYMVFHLPGVEVAEGFRPSLLEGNMYILQLPENWRDDFSGFLICAAVSSFFDVNPIKDNVQILMKQADVVLADDVVWKVNDSDGDMCTWVRYVSFGSLRDTVWWKDQIFTALQFTIICDRYCAGVGVSLVKRETTSTPDSSSSIENNKYNPQLKVLHHDLAANALTLSLPPTAVPTLDEKYFPSR